MQLTSKEIEDIIVTEAEAAVLSGRDWPNAWPIAARLAAHAIFERLAEGEQAHAADLAERQAALVRTEKGLRDMQNVALKAQTDFATRDVELAKMQEALGDIDMCVDACNRPDDSSEHLNWIQERAKKALAATPKRVLAMKTVELKDGICLTTGYRGMPGEWVTVALMEGEGDGEG